MYRGTVVYPFRVPSGETTVLYVRSHVIHTSGFLEILMTSIPVGLW